VANTIAPANIGKGFPIGSTRQGFGDLELRELGFTAEPNTTIHRSFTAFCSSGKDHRAFEFRQGSKHGQDQPTVWASRVDHGIGN
jgi:hypothetical protein